MTLQEKLMAALPIVSCDNCGACCMSMMFPPFDEEDGAIELPSQIEEELISAIEAGRNQVPGASRIGLPCFWLDTETRRCKHYEFRPGICRRFEPGNNICIKDRAIHGISDRGS